MTGRVARISLLAGLLGWAIVGRAAPAEDPRWYVKKATWQQTLQASREALTVHEARQTEKVDTSKPSVVLGQWFHMGPFVASKKGFNEAFPPEKSVDLNETHDKLRWTAHPEWEDGIVHTLHTPGTSATYLYREITANGKKNTVTAGFGSDDGIAVWLNGKRIHSKDVPRGPAPNQDMVTLNLKDGPNQLLVKIYNISGGCGFFFALEGQIKKPDARSKTRDALWGLVQRDFTEPQAIRQMNWEKQDSIWLSDWKAGDLPALADRYVKACRAGRKEEAAKLAGAAADAAALDKVRAVYYESRRIDEAVAELAAFNFDALRLAIRDLMQTHGAKYPKGQAFLDDLDRLEEQAKQQGAAKDADRSSSDAQVQAALRLKALREEALLANPLLNFEKLLVIRRKADKLGLPQNWQGNCALPRGGYDNELAVLSPVGSACRLTTLHRPEGGRFIGDVDLHWDAARLLFSSTDAENRWQIFELALKDGLVRQVTSQPTGVDNYDACYLPNGRIVYGSTACFHGVPCVGGGNQVANLFLAETDGSNARQLCFDQDHNWCPTVLNNGQVMYARWEYSDTPHYFTRLLMSMNPDGTSQMELYGSNSYWPNSTFYARPIPNHPTRVVAVISGHHGVPRMGELVIFDPAQGRHEASGAVQRIPGHGKEVQPVIADGLVNGSWPKFLHPWPLSDKYFLVSCQPTPHSNWGLYLVDVFDNLLLLHEENGYAIFEPVPLRASPRPPVVPDRVDLTKKEAIVYLNDIYRGEGLRGVPRGTVKSLRLFEFHFAYNSMGGHINIGIDGPWDVHRILGTVPVGPDGSAIFRVPANTPIALQPLDAEGKALQVMRSWLTAMPGEVLSCVGCHERQNQTVGNSRRTLAAVNEPADIEPWRGPPRGFSFAREVQGVLDRYCVGCHDGQPKNGKEIPDLRADGKASFRNFTPSYVALHPYVRRPGPESDYHLQMPLEYHADTSELVQMLRKGHKNVKLDGESWDRLLTWIDLNVPDKGTWSEHRQIAKGVHERRLEMRKKYAGIAEDPEVLPETKAAKAEFVKPEPLPAPQAAPKVAGWPFDAAAARQKQLAALSGLAGPDATNAPPAKADQPPTRTIDLDGGVKLELVLVPAGQFAMGSGDGPLDERPACSVRVERPFWMARFEITNEQYAPFDPQHDSGYISVFNKDHSNRGQAVNRSTQPVIRVSWQQAMEYCRWLSARTGLRFSLPSEAQWEWACRAGADTPLNWGAVSADFGKLGNLADERLTNLTIRDSPKWIPSIASVNDGSIVTDNVGKYAPNAFGLHDMHGNAAEWTLSDYKPYPYADADGRNSGEPSGRKVVRGGSFYDRPHRARSAFRLDYPAWQRVYNVGFRVVCEAGGKDVVMK